MAAPNDEQPEDEPLTERLLDLFLFAPTGLVVSAIEEFPTLVERGRRRLGVHVNSARAVGQFAVKAGQHEVRRRSETLRRVDPTPPVRPSTGRPAPARPLRTIPRLPPDGPVATPGTGAAAAPAAAPVTRPAPAARTGHVPAADTLAIPGFDTLSASQVVQRLDGLSRPELVAVRAYESAARGRRTILNRVDQLLDERS